MCYPESGKTKLNVCRYVVQLQKENYFGKLPSKELAKILAPIVGLSEVIVDIVETGTTLKENNLSVFEKILPISARLIANKASFKFKNDSVTKVMEALKKQCEETR